MILSLAAVLGAGSASPKPVADATVNLFPVPQSVRVAQPGANVPVSASFTIVPERGPQSSDVLLSAISATPLSSRLHRTTTPFGQTNIQMPGRSLQSLR